MERVEFQHGLPSFASYSHFKKVCWGLPYALSLINVTISCCFTTKHQLLELQCYIKSCMQITKERSKHTNQHWSGSSGGTCVGINWSMYNQCRICCISPENEKRTTEMSFCLHLVSNNIHHVRYICLNDYLSSKDEWQLSNGWDNLLYLNYHSTNYCGIL